MKRRGFKPGFVTFVTLMSGYMRIEDWQTHTKQLDNVHTIMQNFTEFAEAAKRDPVLSRELLPVPYNAYIGILGDARLYQKMFDVYHDLLDQSSPLAPNHHTFAAMLHALSERRDLPGVDSLEGVHTQNASDAKLIWKQYTKAFPNDPSDRVVVAFLRCLRYGRPSDVLFGLDVVREYCGLSKPGQAEVPARVPLSPHLVGAILDLCLYGRKPSLAVHYARKVMERPVREGEGLVIDRANMEQLLRAYNNLGALGAMGEADQALETLRWMLKQEALNPHYASRIRPRLETYAVALVACWQGADWASATKMFELLTGCRAEDFLDNYAGPVTIKPRPKESRFEPDETVLSAMLRTSLATNEKANMRQCLRMVEYYKVSEMLVNTISFLQERVQETQEQQADHDGAKLVKVGKLVRNMMESRGRRFYAVKLAEVVIEIVDTAMPYVPKVPGEDVELEKAPIQSSSQQYEKAADTYVVSEDERRRWLDLRQKAKEVVKAARRLKIPISPPMQEDNPLGSMQGVAHTDRRVDFDMTSRYLHSA